jgi:hypothetical protein
VGARRATAALVVALVALSLSLVPAGAGASPEASAGASPGARAAPSAGAGSTASAAAATECGAAAPEVLATTAGAVAERIYLAEIKSSEVLSDKRQIETDGPLLNALASGDNAAIKAAVHTLVYSHTHIVRLRVSRGSALLADDGGPYILAPVTGRLRLHGREVGHFVFSVQDDLGYVKLETRFIGAPLVMRSDSGDVPVGGLLSPGPDTIPDHGPVSYRGATYEAYSFKAQAYPSGRLRISLLLAVPSDLAARTCEQIKTAELGLVSQRISRRFKLSAAVYPSYVRLVNTMTHALVYVRSGSRTLAGSSHDTPSPLPTSGTVRFHGAEYEATSFTAPAAGGPVRVHVLVPLSG